MVAAAVAAEGEDDEEGGDGGEFMKDTTRPTLEDGILSIEKMQALYTAGGEIEKGSVKSLYDEAWTMAEKLGLGEEKGRTFGGRENPVRIEKGGVGWGEPNWTSYTPSVHASTFYLFSTEADCRRPGLFRRLWHLTLGSSRRVLSSLFLPLRADPFPLVSLFHLRRLHIPPPPLPLLLQARSSHHRLPSPSPH